MGGSYSNLFDPLPSHLINNRGPFPLAASQPSVHCTHTNAHTHTHTHTHIYIYIYTGKYTFTAAVIE